MRGYHFRFAYAALSCIALLFTWTGCGASSAEIRRAKNAGYATDFANVFNGVVEVVAEHYQIVKENAVRGYVRTKPTRVQATNRAGTDDREQGRNPLGTANTPFGQSTTSYVRQYVELEVNIVGRKPYQVRVTGRAFKLDIGAAQPVELKDGDRPAWLDGRINSISVAIYRKLQRYAVEVQGDTAKPSPVASPAEPQRDFGAVPKAAAQVIGAVRQAAVLRDFDGIRSQMSSEFQWRPGEPSSADTAVSIWRADLRALAKIVEVLDAGCVKGAGSATVTCPPEHSQKPGYSGWRAGFALQNGHWRMVFFVDAE